MSHYGRRSYGKTQPDPSITTAILQPRTPGSLPVLLAIALIMRLVFLALPAFSTDPLRFLSDGINLLEGRNPYTAPPALEIPYGHLRSFYPPLMELFFAGAAALMRDAFIFRLLGGVGELLFLAWFLYRKRAKPLPRAVMLFLLFNPLSLHEIWREGHLDHIGAFLLYCAILNVRPKLGGQSHRRQAYLFTLLSVAWKFVGVLALAFRLCRAGGNSPLKRVWLRLSDPFALLVLLFFVLQFLPALFFTAFAERGLTVYLYYWHHGNGIVQLLRAMGFADAHGVYLVQRGIVLLLVIIAMLYLLRRISYTDALVLAVGTLLVLFPVQHPWYYFLLFPFIMLYRRWRFALVALCLLAPLSYFGYTENWASLGFWVMLVVWMVGVGWRLRESSPTDTLYPP